ncbi:MAG TPA: cytochrome c oxidase subunit 3 [Acidimicrobiales bacterium]
MLALPPAPAPARPRLTFVGTAVAGTALLMMVGGMLAAYLAVRDAAGGTTAAWLPEGAVIPEVAANIMLVTVLACSITAQWAVWSMHRGDRAGASLALTLTALFGLALINAQAYIWVEMELPLADAQFNTLFYAVTGTFVALVIAAIVMAAITAFRSLAGRYSTKDTEGIAANALAWHLLTVAFAAIWFVVYVIK